MLSFSYLPKHHLLLHVDINRTIIQTDVAGGKSLKQTLISNICSQSYGEVTEKNEWILRVPPNINGEDVHIPDAFLSYSDYVDTNIYPISVEIISSMSLEKRREWLKENRSKRQAMYYGFLEDGNQGKGLDWALTLQEKSLTLPSGKGMCNIIPSFFHLLNTLSEEEWPFTLLFRTFGSDLPAVINELKQFVFGELEYKPKGRWLKQLRSEWKDPIIGAVYRDNNGFYIT